MGFLSGRGIGSFADSFLRSYESFSKQQREQEEDDRKKAQITATSGFLSRLPGFKDMGDMTNVDPSTAYQVYNSQEALRAKQDEINRKREAAQNTARLYSKILPQGAIPEGTDFTDIDPKFFDNIYDSEQKRKQIALEQQNKIALENMRYGNDAKLKGMATYADTLKEREAGGGAGGNFGGAPKPGNDNKGWLNSAAMYYQAKKDRGEPFTKQDEAGIQLVKSQLGETKALNDGSIVRVSPGLSVFGGNDQQPGKQVVEQISKSDVPLSEVTKNKEKARAIAELVDSLENLKGFVDKHGMTPVKMLNPEAFARSNSAYRTTMNVLKSAEDYGALQAGEIQNLQKIISDPTDLGSIAAGKKGAVAVYNDLIDTYTNRLDSYSDLTNGQVDGRSYLAKMKERREKAASDREKENLLQKNNKQQYSNPLPRQTSVRSVFGGSQ